MGESVRIGVFYDGTWFAYLSDFYATTHPRRARISLDGFHDALRWHVHLAEGVPLHDCVIREAHYVRGRIETPATGFDEALALAGITRHDLPLHGGKEKGVDVHLALETWDRAVTAGLRWVVLVTGDADFTPLVARLVKRGVRVLVPVADPRRAPQKWPENGPRTASPLRANATDTPGFDALFAPADQGDYPLRSPFTRTTTPVAPSGGAPRGRRYGRITGWRDDQPHGFITDTRGGSWYASRDDLPGGAPMLPVGTQVSFTGSPAPGPGRKYPRAQAIELA